MQSPPHRSATLAVWQAGVAAVLADRLVESVVKCLPNELVIGDSHIHLNGTTKIEVVGAGKAGAGMVRGLRRALLPIADRISLSGWVNVPADCVEDAGPITLFPARPPAHNEPTAEGVYGTEQILQRVSALGPRDTCVVLISGGGSALLPAPVPQITLQDKILTTRMLSAAGASIVELNTVRSQLSQVKGGGLLRHCRAGRMVTLIISDVIGDPIDIIASGPTVLSRATPQDALTVLKKYDPDLTRTPPAVIQYLMEAGHRKASTQEQRPPCPAEHYVIGSNSHALNAAARHARATGYTVISLGSENSGEAAEHGRRLAEELMKLKSSHQPACLLAGGETTVTLTNVIRPGKGGRNQEVVLAAMAAVPDVDLWRGVTLLSGGTDGEDGPTDAAGGFADLQAIQNAQNQQLSPLEFLQQHDAYTFLDKIESLLRTGPTHTNVMDLAVGLVTP